MFADRQASSRDKMVEWYYLATPLFLLLDVFGGTSIRVSALDGAPMLKYGYYGGCFLAGVLFYRHEVFSAAFGLLESVANIFLLIWSVMGPYYDAIKRAAEGEFIQPPMNIDHIINFVLVGAVLLVSFFRNPLIKKAG
ncbi:hypothetical protein Pla175_28610 [Pirellulimonas nuda]|uniref:Uncharacterized protein n=1 Tax=Pirellulimonas nuda TaxID=2528009 RepID=A0A518DDB5_9BACT|nr:hypothetical protein [Pirellulimonas nuda]QDU89471.1 hypothetical protein Pla175_28610 [Pirellulimonas nuda]